MFIELNPVDTLFFKDGKPFSMGNENVANGIFPPYPSVIYGALRSAYFGENPKEIVNANTNNDKTNNLVIKNIYYKIFSENAWVYTIPIPLDMVGKRKNEKSKDAFLLKLTQNDIISSLKTTHRLIQKESDKDEKVEGISNGLLKVEDLNQYLKSVNKNYTFNSMNDFIKYEPKIGIARNNQTKTTEEGHLYRVDLNRIINLKLVVEFEGLEIKEKGFLKLGAEGKTVSYESLKNEIKIESISLNNKIFKLYFATPTYFKNGWLPEWINKDTFQGEYNKIKLKLLTASLGKTLNIGGFDMKTKTPKPMRKFVPAGSVYYFELEDINDKEKLIEVFHNKSICDDKILSKQGFGISYLGNTEE